MGLRPRAQFNTRVESCHFNGKEWQVQIRRADGSIAQAAHTFLVAATGQLNVPNVPANLDRGAFHGPSFHTAEWDHAVDLAGKRVACVGTGASAIQALPIIAPAAAELKVFQRSPGWIIAKNDYAYSALTKWLFRFVPGLRALYRAMLFAWMDYAWFMMVPDSAEKPSWRNAFIERTVRNTRPLLPLPELESAETIGCKRLLITDLWFPMFQRPNVELITQPVAKVLPRGLQTADGATHEVDVIVYATGFKTNDFVPGVRVSSSCMNAQTLRDVWGDAPTAYMGGLVPGFPNLWLTYGPNMNVNHSSVLSLMEHGVDFFRQLVERTVDGGFDSFQCTQRAHDDYNRAIQSELDSSVFNANCDSWYKKNSAKRIVNNYPGPVLRYWMHTRRVDWNDIELR